MNIASPHYAPPRLSSEAIALVKHFEGCFLDAYRDPVGVVTIGYGHTGHIRRGMSITPQEAEDLLMEDLDIAAADVRHDLKVPLNDNEFGALVSLAFNIGGSAFKHSTLLDKLNRGDRRRAAEQFCRFVNGHVGGRRVKLKGLMLRREAEREMFLAPVGQLVRDGKMVLAGRTIPVDHPTYDLAYAGPPQPPQHHNGPANPYLVAASADGEPAPAVERPECRTRRAPHDTQDIGDDRRRRGDGRDPGHRHAGRAQPHAGSGRCLGEVPAARM